MAESMPTQSNAEQSVFEAASTSVKNLATSTLSTIDPSSKAAHNTTSSIAPEAPQDIAPIPKQNGYAQETVDATNGIAQPIQDNSAPSAPVQTTTGEPNGTNDSVAASADGVQDHRSSDYETPLFSASLISPEVAALLPEGYTIRPLRRSDYHRGFLDVLRVLTTVGDPSFETFSQHFTTMASMASTYHTLVVLDGTNSVVGTGAVIVERKFIHNMGLVGHIEDIAVAKNQQGKKLGLRIIQALDYVAENVGCYKCILDCSEANEGFYVKCGFKRAGLEMAHYYGRD